MKLHQVNLESRILHVRRLKNGLSTTHPLRPEELRALRVWLKRREAMAADSAALFLSERRQPINRRTVWALIRSYGKMAGLDVDVHPHMLRHACGFALADQGADTRLIQDYLGHRSIQHTVLYTATNPARFEILW